MSRDIHLHAKWGNPHLATALTPIGNTSVTAFPYRVATSYRLPLPVSLPVYPGVDSVFPIQEKLRANTPVTIQNTSRVSRLPLLGIASAQPTNGRGPLHLRWILPIPPKGELLES